MKLATTRGRKVYGARLGMFEDRLARLFYKLAVEMDMGMSAVLDCI